MPITTFLHDGELNQPTGDAEIDELLAEVKRNSGRNYQIVTRRALERSGLFGLRRREFTRMSVYLEVGGMGPWQWLSCTNDAATVRAYLLGMLGGHDDFMRSNACIERLAITTGERNEQSGKATPNEHNATLPEMRMPGRT